MRRQAAASIWSSMAPRGISRSSQWPQFAPIGRRCVQIAATPSSTSPPNDQWNGTSTVVSHPDARFEVLGSPFSLLSVSLSASQPLYTRRGTLTALSGKPESVVSTLSLLSPLTRLAGRIPFLYQRIQATAPITALIASRQQQTTFAVVYLDGRVDWVVAQRDALLAWTGHALVVKPRLNPRAGLGVQYWGNSVVTGRGLVALVGKGQVYQISLKEGEEYVVHPSAVVAYTANGKGSRARPYRFKSRALNLQIPSLAGWLPETRFMREMRKTDTWKFLARVFFSLRTWTRRTIWGDRLFLHFQGPTTILVQSRASRLRDSLSNSEVNEIADVQAGVVQEALARAERKEMGQSGSTSSSGSDSGPVPGPLTPDEKPTTISFATVRGGKVDFQGTRPS